IHSGGLSPILSWTSVKASFTPISSTLDFGGGSSRFRPVRKRKRRFPHSGQVSGTSMRGTRQNAQKPICVCQVYQCQWIPGPLGFLNVELSSFAVGHWNRWIDLNMPVVEQRLQWLKPLLPDEK